MFWPYWQQQQLSLQVTTFSSQKGQQNPKVYLRLEHEQAMVKFSTEVKPSLVMEFDMACQEELVDHTLVFLREHFHWMTHQMRQKLPSWIFR